MVLTCFYVIVSPQNLNCIVNNWNKKRVSIAWNPFILLKSYQIITLLIIIYNSIVKVINIIYLYLAKKFYWNQIINMATIPFSYLYPNTINGFRAFEYNNVSYILSIINNMSVLDVNYYTFSNFFKRVLNISRGLDIPLARSFLEKT